MNFKKILRTIAVAVFIFSVGQIERVEACGLLPSKAFGTYTLADFNLVCAADYMAVTGFSNNPMTGFTAGFCSQYGDNTGAMHLCTGGLCTAPFQQAQCGMGGCAAFTVATAANPIFCEYSCTPLAPNLLPFCDKTITSGSCGFGNGVCAGCNAAVLDMCTVQTSASPTPSSAPSPVPVPAIVPIDHQCGGGATTSIMPSPVPSTVTSFSQLMNPMAACCWNGWCQSTNPASCKLDCIQAVPGNDFLAFYNAGGPLANPPVATARVDEDAGVLYPNRLFLLDRFGTPYNGFYNSKGARCKYRTPGSSTQLLLKAPEQMKLFDDAILANKPPPEVDADCCNVMIFALERTCPTANPTSTTQILTVSPPSSTVTRCTAAASLRAHFFLYDICDPTKKKRARFHGVTSLEAATNVDIFKTQPIDMQKIIRGTFPAGTCPEGFKAGSGDTCVIN